MYKVRHKKPKVYDYDLVVIGSGAGSSAAHIVAKTGKHVAIVEQGTFGGECPNFGCVPTKALLQAAETYETVKNAADFGVHSSSIRYDYSAIRDWKSQAVRNTGSEEGPASYKEDGIDVFRGHAHFLSPWVLAVGEKRLSAKKFLIATGTKNAIPPIPGLKETGFITYKEAIDLDSPPKRIFIIGGGAIGCEFAQLFSAFGSHVQIAEFTPRLLVKEDVEVGELLQAVFEERGIGVHVGAQVINVASDKSGRIVTFTKNGTQHTTTVDEVMIATGKVPCTDLGLENAGVKYDRRAIAVDRYMQTSAPHIYAAGDVTGKYMFTHVATYQSRLAANNMFNRLKWTADYRAVPRCIFVSPECASVGPSEEELRASGVKFQTAAVPISLIGRSSVTQQDTGFVKVIADKRGRLLAASVVAPRAGEVIHELTLAIQTRQKASAIEWTIHAFPTWSEAVRLACSKIRC